MEFATQKELYEALIPVFKVKQRLISITKYQITNEDIWNYLIKNKWRYSHNLLLEEVVNDIITIDINKINIYEGDKNEKN